MAKEIDKAVLLYKEAKAAYYAGYPVMSDAEFDKLEDRIRALDPHNPVLSIVGAPVTARVKIQHDPPMLSARKVKTVDDVKKWAGNNVVVWGYKVDGMSVDVEYIEGVLSTASTRGDGDEGEDITPAAMNVMPVSIKNCKKTFKVRGEAYIAINDFNRINDALGGEYDSPRNMGTSTMMVKDPTLAAERHMRFMAWELIVPGQSLSVVQKIDMLTKWGFETADVGLVKNVDGFKKIFDDVTRKRATFDFEMDGVVFKIDDPAIQAQMSVTEHHPRWMVALKFEAAEDETKLTSITWQVGRTFVLTPVAELEPVHLAHAEIKRATLHNARFVRDNKIGAGDMLYIVRSGDVIPKVTGVAKSVNRPEPIPKTCPACGGVTRWGETKVDLFCTNADCPEANIQSILYFLDTIKVKGIGEKTVRRMVADGKVKKPVSVYKLTTEYLTKTFGVNGQKMYDRIVLARKLAIDVFLESLGIELLGQNASRQIAARVKSVDGITPQLVDELFGASSKKAAAMKPGLAKRPWKSFIDAGVVIGSGVVRRVTLPPVAAKPKTRAKPVGSTRQGTLDVLVGKPKPKPAAPRPATAPSKRAGGSSLAGKSVYVTGSVEGYTKQQLEDFVVAHGMVWKELSQTLDYLVTGESGVGMAKIKKVDEWKAAGKATGLEILEWDAFVKKLKG